MTKVDTVREAGTIAGVVVVVALITGFFLWPPMMTREFWISDKGWLEVLPAIGAVLAATTAAWLSWMNYKISHEKEVSDRFQKGVEMLEDGSNAKKSAGVIVLEDLALTRPGSRHDGWVREFLVSAINDWSTALREALPAPIPSSFRFPPTPPQILRALEAVSRLPIIAEKPKLLRFLYLVGERVSETRLAGITVSTGFFESFDFVRNEAHGFTVRGRFVGEIAFVDCDLQKSRIHMLLSSRCEMDVSTCDLSSAVIFAPRHNEVRLIQCKIDGIRVSGNGKFSFEDCWYEHTKPVIEASNVLNDDETIGVYAGSATGDNKTERGFSLWTPTELDSKVRPAEIVKIRSRKPRQSR